MFTLINSVMLVIGFAVSAMFIVFVCTRLICARIQLNASRRSSIPTAVTVHRFDISHMDHGLSGLDPVLVATFPTKKYGDGVFSYGEDSQCVVCLAEYQEKDMLRILPHCQHCFHVNCIDAWLQQHSTCPVCRISLRISPERKRTMQPMFSLAVRSSSVSTLNMNTYNNNLYTSPGFSSRSFSNPRMEPIQEDHVASELDAAENGESSFTGDDQVQKDVDHHDSDIIMSRVHPVHTSP